MTERRNGWSWKEIFQLVLHGMTAGATIAVVAFNYGQLPSRMEALERTQITQGQVATAQGLMDMSRAELLARIAERQESVRRELTDVQQRMLVLSDRLRMGAQQ